LLLLAWLDAEIPLADSDWKPGEGRPMLETDGRRLYLPAVFGSREEAIVAVQHGAGHLAFDSYARVHIEALFARAGMSHPPVDDQNRITWRPLFAPFAERMFRFQVLFDLAEDLRVNARLHARIPGFLARLLRLARRPIRCRTNPRARTTGRRWRRIVRCTARTTMGLARRVDPRSAWILA
jgi:nitric oxide reductase NorD protein